MLWLSLECGLGNMGCSLNSFGVSFRDEAECFTCKNLSHDSESHIRQIDMKKMVFKHKQANRSIHLLRDDFLDPDSDSG